MKQLDKGPIISAVISSLTSLAAFGLSKLVEKRLSRKKIYKERLEKLYIPFYKLCIKKGIPENLKNAFYLRPKMLDDFLELFMENVNYMSTYSQKLFREFYAASNSRMTDMDHMNDYYYRFKILAVQLLSEHQTLSRKLKQPKPLRLFL